MRQSLVGVAVPAARCQCRHGSDDAGALPAAPARRGLRADSCSTTCASTRTEAAAGIPAEPAGAGRRAAILIAGRNFGVGSSREAAVYALVDYGIRCVVAPSFGDIFAANAVKNGLVPARVSEADGRGADRRPRARRRGGRDRPRGPERPHPATTSVAFEIDPVWRMKLLNG